MAISSSEEVSKRENTQRNMAIATLKDWQSYDLLTREELDKYLARVMEEYEKDKENETSIQSIVREARDVVYSRDEMIESLNKQGYQPKSTTYHYEADQCLDKDAADKKDILAKFGYRTKSTPRKPRVVRLKIAPKRIVARREDFKKPRNTMPGQMTLFQFV